MKVKQGTWSGWSLSDDLKQQTRSREGSIEFVWSKTRKDTVAKLIAKLQEFEPNAEVSVTEGHDECSLSIFEMQKRKADAAAVTAYHVEREASEKRRQQNDDILARVKARSLAKRVAEIA